MNTFVMTEATPAKPKEKKFYEGYPSMIRLSHKGQLIDDCAEIYKRLAKDKEVLPKAFRKKAERTVTRDFMKGISVINKNNKIFVEMPKLEKVGNGIIKKVNSNTKNSVNNEVEVHAPVVRGKNEVIDV